MNSNAVFDVYVKGENGALGDCAHKATRSLLTHMLGKRFATACLFCSQRQETVWIPINTDFASAYH